MCNIVQPKHSLDMSQRADVCTYFLPPCFPPDRFPSLRPLPVPLSAAALSVEHSNLVRVRLKAQQAAMQEAQQCGLRQRTIC